MHIVRAGSFVDELRSQQSCNCAVALLLNRLMAGMSSSSTIKLCISPLQEVLKLTVKRFV